MNARVQILDDAAQPFRVFDRNGVYLQIVYAASIQDALQAANRHYGIGCMVCRSNQHDHNNYMWNIMRQDYKQELEYFRMRDTEKAESQGFRRGISSKNWSR